MKWLFKVKCGNFVKLQLDTVNRGPAVLIMPRNCREDKSLRLGLERTFTGKFDVGFLCKSV